jgi:hypothetical protein
LSRDQQRQDKTDDERTRSKSAKKERAHSNCDEQRFPNRAIAEGRHEQVKRRTGPLLINKMKDGLIHAMKVKQPLSFNR